MRHRLVFAAALAAVMWAAGAIPVEAQETSKEFQAVQDQLRRARDRVLPALVRVQPIVEEFRGGRKVNQTGFGSGAIIGPEGYVVTNFHVAGKAKSCICVMANKEEVPAKLVGADPWTDIAVIKLDLSKYTGNTLTWASLGDSDVVQEGDFVLAMGSPFALTRTVTFGIVSCRDRSLGVMGLDGYQRTGQFNTWLQIDALINPGNSGGPLVNMRGEVIGINTRGGAGMGFAVPVNIVKAVARSIIDKGEVVRSWIGITFQPIEKFKKSFLGDVATGGVLVANVDEGSPAQKAGMRPGDIIVSINGKALSARFEEEIFPVAKMVSDFPVGTRLEIDYVRRKVKKTARLSTEVLEKIEGDEDEFKEWGFTAKQITGALAREMRLTDAEGVMVTGAVRGGVAQKAGLGSGDIIKQIDGKDVKDFESFKNLYREIVDGGKEKVLAKVLKGGRTPTIVVLSPGKKKEKDEEGEKGAGGGEKGDGGDAEEYGTR